MFRTAVLLTVLLASAPALAGEALFPRPDAIADDIAFWRRIYTEFDTRSGVIHDSRRLDIVYEELRFDPGTRTRSARNRLVRRLKSRYRQALLDVAAGKRSGLDSAERRVLELWGEDADAVTLRAAAGRLRFQLGQSDKFRAGLVRSGRWLSYIRGTLEQMGLPEELAVLPHVESSFHPGARSKVGATGLWQFTRSTGRRFMRIDHIVDERLDPYASTVAAARLLEHNHALIGSWPLALTAYNHGVAGMRRAVRQVGTDDFAQIARRYRSRTFGFASRNFYPAFLAALEVDRNAEAFFGPIEREAGPRYVELETPAYVAAEPLAEALGVTLVTLRRHNPALLEPVWSGDKRIPAGFALRLPAEQGAEGVQRLASIDAAYLHEAQIPDKRHVVERGDTLSAIAAYYDTTVGRLAALNNLRSRHRIRIGQTLILPAGAAEAGEPATATTVAMREDEARAGRAGAETAGVQQAPASQPAGETAAAASPAVAAAGPTATAAPDASREPDVLGGAEEGTLAHGQPVLAADPSDYTVDEAGYIEVQVRETLGHYAHWLGIRTQRLRDLNGLPFGRPIELGDRLRLDLSRVSADVFEARRERYHREIQSAFFADHRIRGTREHVVRRGESVWTLTQARYRVPFWLLHQYNPDMDPARVSPGATLRIPVIEATGQDG